MATVHYAVEGGVATLTLDAPERRNALSAPLLRVLRDHLDSAEADPTVRAVVLSHVGPVFSSGMDLTQVSDVAEQDQPIRAFPVLLQRLWEFGKPVLARVDGKARAGGIGLVAVCDIVLATAASDFAFTEVRLGLVPAVISVPLLKQLSPREAMELLLTGETFGAERARQLGLINSVCADVAALDLELTRYLQLLRLGEPGALAATKIMARRDRSGVDMAEDFAAMSELSAGFFAGPQAAEGIAAFAAKRRPRWAEGD
ncbi:enoyl-CoA hydratase-related protein [Jatrophihabitans telluris]|uniref:Enoyl-CoA hydratase-related protein n=1 Tax=Jatrophihabitans telluris TaxID=2038343 RepID=A0ABY4QVM8_9ACTN|nr:enoyl-CoA hydratase-related protein [Jatrophihabitans telluris]UQX87503.1 enoyl-CoA hydratase-related protein [Jatrophihabitans telluris]